MISKQKKAFNIVKPLMVFISGLLFFGMCSKVPQKKIDSEYVNEIKTWHQSRIERLKEKNGWLSLAGLFWLEPGENTFGGDSGNDFVVQSKKTYPVIGSFFLNQGDVRFITKKDVPVTHHDQPVKDMVLKDDSKKDLSILKLDTLSWYVIRRGEKLGIRLKDSAHPRLQKLKKIDTFPVNSEWRIAAKLERFKSPKTIDIPTVLGTIDKQMSPGILVFKIEQKTHRLSPLGDKGDLFVIFGDQTNGKETYGGGRFLLVKKPDSNGLTFIDFNKAYNPPCVFSPYATCPLPPQENILSVQVTAGEKMVKDFDH
jgi:uncharacterized protein (DUF1684 family)